MSGNKVKGILRYISQLFETEKEQDIQIGFPTDVEHVTHIGWDGPSVNYPSWMSQFKTAPGFSSAPLDVQNKGQDNAKWVSEDSRRRSTRDLPDLPKASKRKSNKPRQSRKSSNKPKEESTLTRIPIPVSTDHPLPTLPVSDIPKKSRRQKTKENSSGGSSKLRSKAQPASESGSPTQFKSRINQGPLKKMDTVS
ncbi:hypothetical protein AAZX31_13G108600 [Glycine max]|uniref:CRIB domain-containing protein RIC6 n=1 Tax=Glycine soja TaxID=3848 RepID=A0A445HEW0_GLYSO|nr:CRIB domain-containing protein RIC6-like [Glycine soja]KAG4976798.1 hypothetical protein JHK86_036272 [Glycine max]KAG4959369.1 hypothetical protein JHK87_036002 [Glycine soja]KAG5112815.1 hypothetical protein JHK82_036084 [Glycine max]KAH1216589.1 CRIB domain-containing protein RIC6 [Glycine max]RZB72208.1 CRIB domain-containing protein RIC6 [Glycine soja]